MKRRRLLQLLAVAPLASTGLLAAACGDDDSAPKVSSTPSAGPSGAATTAAANSTTPQTAVPNTPVRATPTPTDTPLPRIGGNLTLVTTLGTEGKALLDVLLPLFTTLTGIQVRRSALDPAAAFKAIARGEADAVLLDDPAGEQTAVQAGDLVEGELVMHADMVILGPPADPAKVKGLTEINAVMHAIATTGPFVARGDGSDVSTTELGLWQAAGIDPKSVPGRNETGQAMAVTLSQADQKGAYTLSDRATYLALKPNLKLVVLSSGAKSLLNPYSAYVVNPTKHTNVQAAQARAFTAFMIDPQTQRLIAAFKTAQYGDQEFFADAGKTIETLGN
jgi:tungstate transport system substrate-binding protein